MKTGSLTPRPGSPSSQTPGDSGQRATAPLPICALGPVVVATPGSQSWSPPPPSSSRLKGNKERRRSSSTGVDGPGRPHHRGRLAITPASRHGLRRPRPGPGLGPAPLLWPPPGPLPPPRPSAPLPVAPRRHCSLGTIYSAARAPLAYGPGFCRPHHSIPDAAAASRRSNMAPGRSDGLLHLRPDAPNLVVQPVAHGSSGD